ncbi:MAG: DUF2232 domain-containing protein [Ruminococcaceae bacterium]|nr:DUF2232 domain-containing protein [Oscillospiraceae bacterium]
MKQAHSFSATDAEQAVFDYKEIRLSAADLLLLCLFYIAGSVFLPVLPLLPMSELVRFVCAGTVLLLSIAAQTRMLGSFSAALGHTLTLLVVAFLFDSPLLAALLGALITSVSALAKLFLCKPAFWLFLLPLAAYGLSFGILHSPFSAALCLISFPCGWVTAYLLQKEQARVSSICRIALILGGVIAISLAVGILRLYGNLNLSILKELIEEVRLGAIGALSASLEQIGETVSHNIDSVSYAEQTVNTVINYLPALPVVLCCLFGWILHTAVMRVALAVGLPPQKAARMMSFDMSWLSAIVYFLALFLSWMLASEKTALYGTVAGNLCLCLVPGMLVTAWIAIQTLLLTRAPSCLSVILYLLILLLTVTIPTLMLPLIAAFGATVILVGSIRRYLAQKKT